MSEQDRIKLFEIIKEDNNTLRVKDVVEVFSGIFLQYFEISKIGRTVKSKLTEDEYVSYVTGFVNSFLSSLYASASKNNKELKKRMDLISQCNKDVLITKEEFEAHGESLRSRRKS